MSDSIVSAVALVIVAVIEALAARDRKSIKHQNEKAERRAQQRAEEARLSMKLLDATLQLSIVCSNALTGGHNNGNVERARLAAEEAQNEYSTFLQNLASQQISR